MFLFIKTVFNKLLGKRLIKANKHIQQAYKIIHSSLNNHYFILHK